MRFLDLSQFEKKRMHYASILLSLFLLFSSASAPAQTLIPWLGANGQYGYATEAGRVVIPPVFDQPGRIFRKNEAAVQEMQDGKVVHILRNGRVLNNAKHVASAAWITPGKDTIFLPHLAVADRGEKIEMIHLTSGVRKEYLHPRQVKQPAWFKVSNEYSYPSPDQYLSSCKFYYGAHRVFKGAETVNFLDTALNEIFPRDFSAGTIAGHGYFLLADQQHKMGVGDRSGAIRVPFVWDQLEMAKRPGFFIANLDKETYGNNLKSRVGLLDADGRLVIDTVHQVIYALSDQYLVVTDQNQSGVMDYSGKWVLPQEFTSVGYFFGDYFRVEYPNGRQNVVNSRGEKQFATDFKHILPAMTEKPRRMYLECIAPDNRSSLADSSFQFLYSDTLTRVLNNIQLRDTTLVHLRVNDGGHDYYGNDRRGVRDVQGRSIVPGRFHRVDKLHIGGADLYLVRRDSLYGVYDTEGRVVLPVEFLQIIGNPEKPELWARRQTDKLYVAYDAKGAALPVPPAAIPLALRSSLFASETKPDGSKEVVLLNGARLPETEVRQYLQWPRMPALDGNGFFFNDRMDPVPVVNAYFQPVVPEGYTVPQKLLYAPELGTGLLPVFKMSGSGQVESCGVVNTSGAWVLPPKKGVRYFPMSDRLIAERAANQTLNTGNAQPENVKVIRTDKNGVQETLTFNLIAYRLFSPANNFTMLMGNAGRTNRFAYYNASGERLTDDNLLDGGKYLGSRNIVTVRDKQGDPLDVIMDGQGSILAELPGLEADRLYKRGDQWKVDFFTAKDKRTGLQGILDSMGQTVLPFRYKDLYILSPGRLLACTNAQGRTELLDWQGRVLHTADGAVTRYNMRLYEAANGYLLLGLEGLSETAVLSPDNQLVRVVPAESPGYYSKPPEELPHLATFVFRPLQKHCWVDFVTGRVYGEQ